VSNNTRHVAKLRAWREARLLTLGQVSDLSGISVPMLSRVERGERQLSPMAKARLARALRVRISDLFDPEEAAS
jgi:transcriptional regulator with XRE-family HTH domain